jgi:hypothetical protein
MHSMRGVALYYTFVCLIQCILDIECSTFSNCYPFVAVRHLCSLLYFISNIGKEQCRKKGATWMSLLTESLDYHWNVQEIVTYNGSSTAVSKKVEFVLSYINDQWMPMS